MMIPDLPDNVRAAISQIATDAVAEANLGDDNTRRYAVETIAARITSLCSEYNIPYYVVKPPGEEEATTDHYIPPLD